MAIPLNPGNFGATAAFAGNSIGNLGIPVPNYSALTQGAANFAEGIQASKNRALQEKQMAIQQAKEGRLESMAQQQMSLQMREQAIKEKQFQLQIDNLSHQQAKEKSAEQLQAQGTAAYMISQLPKQDWEDNKQSIINGLVGSKIINEDQGKTLATKSYRDVLIQAKVFTLTSKNALELQKLDAKEGGGASGSTIIRDPETGTVVYEKKAAGKPAENDLQKDMTTMQDQLQQMEGIAKNYKKEFSGLGGVVKSGIGAAASWLGIEEVDPSLKGAAEFTKKRSEWAAQVNYMKMQTIKALSGVQYSDKQLQFMDKITPSETDSASVFEGKTRALTNYIRESYKMKAVLLKEGYQLSTPKFNEEFNDRLSSVQSKIESGGATPKSQPSNIDDNYINEVAKAAGKSPEQVRQDMKAKGWIK